MANLRAPRKIPYGGPYRDVLPSGLIDNSVLPLADREHAMPFQRRPALDGIEYQVRDRLSFMRFLGLQLEDRVADAKTVWLFIGNG
jgi:hypothetical protein